MTTATREPYTFNNDKPSAAQMLSALGEMHDEFAIARLERDRAAGRAEHPAVYVLVVVERLLLPWVGETTG